MAESFDNNFWCSSLFPEVK